MSKKKRKSSGSEFSVMEATVKCWKCHMDFKAIGILHFDGSFYRKVLHISHMDHRLVDYIASRFPQFVFRRVKAADKDLYVNVCTNCGITNGDKPLHFMNGVFNPLSSEDAGRINIYPVLVSFDDGIPVSGRFEEGNSATRIMQGAQICGEKPVTSVGNGSFDVGMIGDGERRVCPGCGSCSVVTRDSWLCYGYKVDVCLDCERTKKVANGHVLYGGGMILYDDDAHPEDSYAEELSQQEFERNYFGSFPVEAIVEDV